MLHILANVADYLQTIYIYAFGILFYAKQLISTRVSLIQTQLVELQKRKKKQKNVVHYAVYIPQTSFIVVSMPFQTHP